MNAYRQGAILGLTVAETFILLTFFLLIAMLGLVQSEDSPPESDATNAPQVWMRPEEIEALVNADKQARMTAEQERDQAQEQVEKMRKAHEQSEQVRMTAEQERNQAQEQVEEMRKAQEQSEQARITAEQERDLARGDLALMRRKGENPPCWYQVVSAGNGKTRERAHYVFNVAIHEDSIELAPRSAPPGGASDDGGGLYTEEWKRLHIEKLPYGKKLSDEEFEESVRNLAAQGKNRQVRTYECVFSVMVWDKTPDHAKKRWKYAHDRVIEKLFGAYTVRNDEWVSAD